MYCEKYNLNKNHLILVTTTSEGVQSSASAVIIRAQSCGVSGTLIVINEAVQNPRESVKFYIHRY